MYPIKVYINSTSENINARLNKEIPKLYRNNYFVFAERSYSLFLRRVIAECNDGYAVICHDDVMQPYDFFHNVGDAIDKANYAFGKNNWGALGNAGIEALSFEHIRFLQEKSVEGIPYRTPAPVPAVFLEGNVLLLNIHAIRTRNSVFPSDITRDADVEFACVVALWFSGLICAIDSSLFVYHDDIPFCKKTGYKFEYRMLKFISGICRNHTLVSSIGNVKCIAEDTGISPGEIGKRKDLYEQVFSVLSLNRCILGETKHVFIITRTRLSRIGTLRRLLDSIYCTAIACDSLSFSLILSVNNQKHDIDTAFKRILKNYNKAFTIHIVYDNNNDTEQFPRVRALRNGLKKVSDDDNSYVWVVDDDDFIMPQAGTFFPIILSNKTLTVCDSIVFNELWDDGSAFPIFSIKKSMFAARNYSKSLSGDNHTPVCSVVYPAKLFKSLISEHRLLGDYAEDYALFLLALPNAFVRHYPIIIAGISYHGKNTVLEHDYTHWKYSVSTFLSEIVNAGVVQRPFFDYASAYVRDDRYNIKIQRIIEYLKRFRLLRLLYSTFILPWGKTAIKVFQYIRKRSRVL